MTSLAGYLRALDSVLPGPRVVTQIDEHGQITGCAPWYTVYTREEPWNATVADPLVGTPTRMAACASTHPATRAERAGTALPPAGNLPGLALDPQHHHPGRGVRLGNITAARRA